MQAASAEAATPANDRATKATTRRCMTNITLYEMITSDPVHGRLPCGERTGGSIFSSSESVQTASMKFPSGCWSEYDRRRAFCLSVLRLPMSKIGCPVIIKMWFHPLKYPWVQVKNCVSANCG